MSNKIKVYVTYKPISIVVQANIIATTGDTNTPTNWIWIRWIDFWEGIIDFATSQYDFHKNEINKWIDNNIWDIIKIIVDNNVLEHYDEWNVIEIDLHSKKIHIWFPYEFNL